MAKRTSYPAGTPSYVDIGSPDPAATAAFYGGLLGWEVVNLGPDAGGYSSARIDGDDVAGIGPQQAPGLPYWTTYFTVDDVADAAKKVEAAGGTVVVPPMDVLDAGDMAVFQDPNGAFFNVWKAKESIGAYRVNEPGTLCWNELNTRHMDAAKTFYADVFGWTYHGDANYTGFEVDGRGVGGFMPMPDQVPADVPDHWMVYFAVADIAAAAAKVSELGGTTMMDPFAVPDVGTMVVAMDPQGAVFSLIELNEPGE